MPSIPGTVVCPPSPSMSPPGEAGNSVLNFSDHIGLEVFPNPASSKVNIHIVDTDYMTRLAIFDIYGRAVWQQEAEVGQVRFVVDLSNNQFGTGIYIITAFNEQGPRSSVW